MPVIVLAKIETVPGGRDAFLQEFARIVPEVRAEQGCIEYGPTVDLPTTLSRQTRLGEDAVMIVEKWETLSDLEAHLIAPHMLAYRERVKDLVASSQLHILQPPSAGNENTDGRS
ncbi:MAG: putative quinol monooxygenase [Planctomycetaceae bacterium]|nr:putative quinol monooxygenase [Planctomycetaceae bacterium]